ncbi:hypothetical protein DZF91_05095 [Actinomadura logoneensis]|uniref:Asp23/Gls24 family envelope stress response protein n=1 Tax=Actinomadura logoneensis TaxID=2293572 RepID=A0A372JRQ4_9ACTN|nr:hypothetical protein [Actinomadura logoneensis]RFU42713.1 hypothetical protein DZF91_05095 [Actinomadura logoneensis]
MTGTAPVPAPGAGSSGSPGVSSADLAERVAAAVTALPDVAGLSTGRSAMLVTYRVGAPVTGVAVRDDAVEIGVVARFGRPLGQIADEVRAVAEPLADERRVDVLIADIIDESGAREVGARKPAIALPGGEPRDKPAGESAGKAGGRSAGEGSGGQSPAGEKPAEKNPAAGKKAGGDGGAGDRAG